MGSLTGSGSHTTAIASATPSAPRRAVVSDSPPIRLVGTVLSATVIVGVTLSARIDAVVAVVVDVR